MTMTKQATEKCSWGLHCSICKNEEEHREEDWDGNLQSQPRMCPQNLQPQTTQNPQLQNLQCPQPQTLQHPQSQSSQHAEKLSASQPQNNKKLFDIPDKYAEQIRLWREWEEKIDRLNKKYHLDCFSSSKLESESDEEDNYKYEHKYKTLIWTIKFTKKSEKLMINVCYKQF